jgi:hydrogenase/urease accessory protein HupE
MGGCDKGPLYAVACVLIVAMLAILAGTLMGLSTPQNFTAPMFIIGFIFAMLDALFLLALATYGCVYGLCYS